MIVLIPQTMDNDQYSESNFGVMNESFYSSLLTPYLLTPWSRVFLEKLTGLQLVKKFSEFCGSRRFFTALTIARLLSLS